MSSATRALVAVIGALAMGAVLSACAGSSGAPTPDRSDGNVDIAPIEAELGAAWLDGGRMIGLVTQGSSMCVPTAEDSSYADGVLQVSLVDDAEGPCTSDFAPRVSLVSIPDVVDASANLVIQVGGDYVGEVILPGVDGTVAESPSEQLPSAGWTTTAGTFVVLLWGSSGCPEYITTAEITGDAAISVSLSGIPADKVCTADIVPNPLLTVVDGLVGVPDVALTLTGPGVEPSTTTILGVNEPAAG